MVTHAVLPFEKEAILSYLDTAIAVWRSKRDGAETPAYRTLAIHYIDAYQSVRMSIFGGVLPEPNVIEPLPAVDQSLKSFLAWQELTLFRALTSSTVALSKRRRG